MRLGSRSRSSLEGVVGLAVVGEVAETIHGVFEEGSGGEDGEADGGAGEGTGDGKGEAGGLADEGEDADGFGFHTQRVPRQPLRNESALRFRYGSILGARRVIAATQLVPDAEAEVNQGRETDEEADDGVEVLQGEGGEETDESPVGHGVADYGGEGGKEGVHGEARGTPRG